MAHRRFLQIHVAAMVELAVVADKAEMADLVY
jgi:hypothetical protein